VLKLTIRIGIMEKWTKKEAIKCLQELRSPFEKKGLLPNIAGKIKELVARNKPQ